MKKLFLIVLLAALAAMSACSGNTAETVEPETASEPSVSVPGPEEAEQEAVDVPDNMNLQGFPIVNEPVVLRIAGPTQPQAVKPYGEMEMFRRFQEQSNVTIEWENVPSNSWNERKNLIFASLDLPDAFYGANALSDSDLINYGSQGLLIPLENLIESYAPNLSKLLADRPDLKARIIAPDGHIYALPHLRESTRYEAYDALFINKTWLDVLNLPIPTTTVQFQDTLRAFKAEIPAKTGLAEVLPLSFLYNHETNGEFSLFGSFGVIDRGNHLQVEDGKVLFAPALPGFKEGIHYLHQLYAEGLIDPESFTHDQNVYLAKAKENMIGAFVAFHTSSVFGSPNPDYAPVLPLQGPDGDQLWKRMDKINMTRGAFAITNTNPHPEVTVRWIDQMYDEKTSIELWFGPVGTNMSETGDGTYKLIPPPDGMSTLEFRHKESPGNQAVMAMTEDRFLKVDEGQDEKLQLVELYKPYFQEEMYPNVFHTLEETEELDILNADILPFVQQKRAEWIISGTVDAEWDAYVTTLRNMGLDRKMEIHQQSYDRFMSLQ